MYRMALVWLALLLLAGATLYHYEKPPDLRIGTLKTVDAVHPLVAADEGYFADENLTVSVTTFGTSTALAEAMASGDLDAAYISIVPAAVWKERGADITIVAGSSRGGDVVCTRDGIGSGKMAVSGKGTMTQVVYDGFVKESLNYTPVYGIEPPDMPTALLVSKDVDAALTAEPFASLIQRAGGACDFDVGTEWAREHGSKYQRNVLVVSGKVLADPALLAKILRVHQRTTDFLNGPDAPAEISKVMGLQFPLTSGRVEYNSSLDWGSMDSFWETAKEEGYLKNVPQRNEIAYGG